MRSNCKYLSISIIFLFIIALTNPVSSDTQINNKFKQIKTVDKYVVGFDIGDVNSDGENELVISTPLDNKVLVYDDQYNLLYNLPFDEAPRVIHISDIDADGRQELIVGTSTGWSLGEKGYAYIGEVENDGDFKTEWISPEYYLRWSDEFDVGDLNSNGKKELVMGLTWWDRKIVSYEYDGTTYNKIFQDDIGSDSDCIDIAGNMLLVGTACWSDYGLRVYQEYSLDFSELNNGRTQVCAGDVDGDGKLEIVRGIGTKCNGSTPRPKFSIYNESYSKIYTSQELSQNNETFVWVATGELISGGGEEIAIGICSSSGGWDVTGNSRFEESHPENFRIFQYDGATYKEIWKEEFNDLEEDVYHLKVSDLDGDGQNELFVSTTNCLYVYAPIETGPTLEIPDTSACPSDTVTIPMTISDAAGIAGAEITIKYDSEILTALSSQTTSLTNNFNLVDSISTNMIAISLANATSLKNESGSLANIEFKIDANAEPDDSCSLLLTSCSFFDENADSIPVKTRNGIFKVKSDITTPGDINRDAIVDVKDAIICLRIIAGLSLPTKPSGHITPNSYEQRVADINKDGDIAADDALLILYESVKNILRKRKSVSKTENAIVCLPARIFNRNKEITVPILLQKGSDVCAASMKLSYNPDVLSVLKVDPRMKNSLIATNTKNRGEIKIALINPRKVVNSEGEIIRVKFKMKNKENRDMGLHLERVNLFDSCARPIETEIKNLLNEQSLHTVKKYRLLQNYPNPFNPITKIRYEIPALSYVKIDILNTSGQKITTLVAKTQNPGSHSLTFDGSNLPTGLYFYRMQANNLTFIKKMVLMK